MLPKSIHCATYRRPAGLGRGIGVGTTFEESDCEVGSATLGSNMKGSDTLLTNIESQPTEA